MLDDYIDSSNSYMELTEVNVTGGRDHCLLNLLAQHMNFQFVYIEAPGRTQGSLRIDDIGGENETFTGGIGLLQNGVSVVEKKISITVELGLSGTLLWVSLYVQSTPLIRHVKSSFDALIVIISNNSKTKNVLAYQKKI